MGITYPWFLVYNRAQSLGTFREKVFGSNISKINIINEGRVLELWCILTDEWKHWVMIIGKILKKNSNLMGYIFQEKRAFVLRGGIGFVGQYLVVYPEYNLVAVRLINQYEDYG
jgi:hypothetical protein